MVNPLSPLPTDTESFSKKPTTRVSPAGCKFTTDSPLIQKVNLWSISSTPANTLSELYLFCNSVKLTPKILTLLKRTTSPILSVTFVCRAHYHLKKLLSPPYQMLTPWIYFPLQNTNSSAIFNPPFIFVSTFCYFLMIGDYL